MIDDDRPKRSIGISNEGNGNEESLSGTSPEGEGISDRVGEVSSMGETKTKEETQETDLQNKKIEFNEVTMYDDLEDYVNSCRQEDLLALNAVKIKRSYPKSYLRLLFSLGERSKVPIKIDLETCIGLLLYSARIVLPEFFDGEKIFVNTFREGDSDWGYSINEDHKLPFMTRVQAENAAYEEAFQRLENQLK
jgi:hypothetical protein